jgi:outer membrane lipoprotein SlyB
MRTKSTIAISLLLLSTVLAGCQTPQESANNAEMTCSAQGLRPGTARYQRCIGATYQANRQQSQQAENAAVAGVAAGVIGGVVLGAAIDDHHGYYNRGGYYRGYRRCGHWGCY